MKTIFIKTENSKINESNKIFLNLSPKLNLRSLNKHIALQNLSVYYTRENIRQHYRNNKLKAKAPTWNGDFELPDGTSNLY